MYKKVSDEFAQGVDERHASIRDMQLKIQRELQKKERECDEANRQKARYESELRRVMAENGEVSNKNYDDIGVKYGEVK